MNTAPRCGIAAPCEQSQVYIVLLVRKRQVRREGIVGNCTAEVEKLNLEEGESGFDQISWDSGKGKDRVVHISIGAGQNMLLPSIWEWRCVVWSLQHTLSSGLLGKPPYLCPFVRRPACLHSAALEVPSSDGG